MNKKVAPITPATKTARAARNPPQRIKLLLLLVGVLVSLALLLFVLVSLGLLLPIGLTLGVSLLFSVYPVVAPSTFSLTGGLVSPSG
jgi:hypothetical protein